MNSNAETVAFAFSVLYGNADNGEPMAHGEFIALVEAHKLSTPFLQEYLGKSYATIKKYLYTETAITARVAKRLLELRAFLDAQRNR